jgi:hypothetical protein
MVKLQRTVRPRVKKLPIKLRYLGLDSNELEQRDKLKMRIIRVHRMLLRVSNNHVLDIVRKNVIILQLMELKRKCIVAYIDLVRWIEPVIPKRPSIRLSIGYILSIPHRSKLMFGFQAYHLVRLLEALKIPNKIVLSNRGSFTGEEILLLLLHRFRTLKTLDDMSYYIFNRDNTQLSRALKWIVRYLFNVHHNLLHDNLAYWYPSFPQFASVIQQRLEEVHNIEYDDGHMNIVSAFLDATFWRGCRPGGGPNNDGSRNDQQIQEDFYSGYIGTHGVKFQTVSGPNGMVLDMHGPISARRCDVDIYNESRINQRLRELQMNSLTKYKIYTDQIYPTGEFTVKCDQPTLKKVRVFIEMDYAATSNLFPYFNYKRNQKVLQEGNNLERSFFVATLLRNCHSTLYGNVTSRSFHISPPTLESFMQVL